MISRIHGCFTGHKQPKARYLVQEIGQIFNGLLPNGFGMDKISARLGPTVMGDPYEKLLGGHGRSQSRPCFWRVFRKWSSAYLNAAMHISMGTLGQWHRLWKACFTGRFKPLNALNVACSAVNLTPPADSCRILPL